MTPTGFTAFDGILIFLYLAFALGFGLRASGRQQSVQDYFLGGRSMPWWAVLLSVVATETSTLTFISIPAVAYGGTLTFLQLTLGYLLGRILVAGLLLPHYFQGELSTAYQFVGQRFGDGMRRAASGTFILTRVLADGVRLFATAIPLAVIFRFSGQFAGLSDFHVYVLAILLITVATGIYTYFGGIRAVIWMDVVQLGLYIGGAGLAFGLLWNALPSSSGQILASLQDAGKLELFRFGGGMDLRGILADPYVFWVSLFGGAVFSIASHGTDQLIVQRLLTTRTLRESQLALVASGVLAMLQFAFFLGIGLLLWIYYGGATADALGLSTLDEVFIKYVVEQMPAGMPGLIVAALLAAAMSSLSSSLSALASSTTLDILPFFRNRRAAASSAPVPEPDDAAELSLSRYVSLIWGLVLAGSAVGFAWLQLNGGGSRPAVVELGLGIAS